MEFSSLRFGFFEIKDFDGGFTKALGGHAWIEVAMHAGKNVKGFMRNGW